LRSQQADDPLEGYFPSTLVENAALLGLTKKRGFMSLAISEGCYLNL